MDALFMCYNKFSGDIMSKKKNMILLFINLFFIITNIYVVYKGLTGGATIGQVGAGEMHGLGYFKAFTVDSNVLVGIVALIGFVFNIKNIIKKEYIIPRWLEKLYLIGASSVFLTIVTVIVFLTPLRYIKTGSFMVLYSGTLFLYHLLNPILAVITIMFVLNNYKISYKEGWLGIIPMVIYAIVYIIMIMTKIWSDFYFFTFGDKYYLIPLVFVVVGLINYGLTCICIKVHNKTTD